MQFFMCFKLHFCSFREIDGLNVGTMDTGDFLVHCQRNKPTIILGNSEGAGRIKLVTSSDIMD